MTEIFFILKFILEFLKLYNEQKKLRNLLVQKNESQEERITSIALKAIEKMRENAIKEKVLANTAEEWVEANVKSFENTVPQSKEIEPSSNEHDVPNKSAQNPPPNSNQDQ